MSDDKDHDALGPGSGRTSTSSSSGCLIVLIGVVMLLVTFLVTVPG